VEAVVRNMMRRSFRVLVVVVVSALGLIGVGGSPPAGAAPAGFVTLGDDGGCVLATLDLDTGLGTAIGDPQPFDCTDLAFAPDGTLYGLAETDGNTAQLVVWNTTTGNGTIIGSIDALTTNGQQGGITFTKEGALYALLVEPGLNGEVGAAATACPDGDFDGPTCLFGVDPTNTSTPTFIGQTAEGRVGGLDVGCTAPAVTLASSGLIDLGSSSGEEIGPLNHGPGENAILTSVDLATGAGTPIGSGIGDDALIRSLAYDATEALWGVGYDPTINPDALADPDAVEDPPRVQQVDDRVYTIDPATGVATEHAELIIDGVDMDDEDANGLAIAPAACAAPLVVAFTG
jgi:hypothetical protein